MCTPIIIDLSNVVSAKEALKAFLVMLSEKHFQLFFNGEEVETSDVVRNSGYIGYGFKEGVLPSHIRNIYIAEPPIKDIVTATKEGKEWELLICVSYAEKRDLQALKQALEEEGFKCEMKKRSFSVVDTDGNILAIYGPNVTRIMKSKVDFFLQHMV
ncbi:MAG: hypothetical protein WC805_01240 [Patescibacteria group bacterium]